MDSYIDNTLFHYTSLDTFMKYILPTKKLKLGRIMNSRDPNEYHSFGIYFMNGEPLQNDISFENFLNAARALKLNSQYLCFCLPEIKQIGSNYYMRRGYDKPKLWELYGDNHRGVCIKLNKARVISEFTAKMAGLQNGQIAYDKITYKDIVHKSQAIEPQTLKSYYLDVGHFDEADFIEVFKQSFFFQKDYDYQDENEFRLAYITSLQQEDLRIDISNAVTALYFGDKVEIGFIEYYKKQLMKEFPELKITHIHWFNGTIDLSAYS